MESLGSKPVYTSSWISVREDTVRRPDGSTGIYAVVDSPDIALIIPADGERLHLVEQYRYPVAGRRWEFPSGSAGPQLDEGPAALAARELREETGLLAGRLAPLVPVGNQVRRRLPGGNGEDMNVALADGCRQGDALHGLARLQRRRDGKHEGR